MGRLVSGTRAKEDPLRTFPPKGLPITLSMTCKSTFGAPPPISMPKRADWIVFATNRVSLVFAKLARPDDSRQRGPGMRVCA